MEFLLVLTLSGIVDSKETVKTACNGKIDQEMKRQRCQRRLGRAVHNNNKIIIFHIINKTTIKTDFFSRLPDFTSDYCWSTDRALVREYPTITLEAARATGVKRRSKVRPASLTKSKYGSLKILG